MVIISTISNTTQTASANSTAAASTAVVKTTITAITPTISTKNSSTVAISPPATAKLLAATSTASAPMTAAQLLALTGGIPAGTVIKDTAANISTNLKTLASLTSIANVTSITLSDTKAGTISIPRTDIAGNLSDPQNTDLNLAVLKKITSSYTLNVSGLSVSDALTLKAPAKTATLSLSISDTVDNVSTNLTALQTAAKAKSIAGIAITPASAGTPKPNLTITAAQLKASPELLATIKGDYDLTITGVAAADAVTIAGNGDKVLKASGSQSSQSKIAISDTASNLVKSIAALETAATAGRLTSITVSDGKALVLTEAQIKADSHFLASQFTTNTTVEATAVAAADVTTVQSLVNANSKLTLTKESISDTAANIQSNLDALEAEVKTGGTTPTPSTAATPTISPTPPAPLGPNQVYNTANGHVYEYVAHTGISWEAAKTEADAKTYAGAKGYLTTITNQEELDFIENSVLPNHNNDGNIYIGGHLVSGSTSKWQWADGPEDGTVFWDNGAVQGQFANWNTSSAYPRTGSGATNEPAVTLNSYFVPQFANSYGTAINSLSAGGNGGYVVEYSEFNTAPTPTPTPKVNPIISNISVTDKGSITVTNSTLVNDIDALKVLTGKYTLNVTDTGVTDALALKAPSKDATLAISIKDTAANIAANWDKLETIAKAKTLTSISVTDSASSLLTMTAAQLKADADALKLVSGDYKLAVTGVAAADVAKTLTTKNIYSVEVKDTAANILKNLTSIQTAVTAAKIQNVVITDAANPALSISDIFALTTTLPNVTLATGVKFNVKDTANMIIAHARDDIGDVLKNAGTVTLTDKTTPNLTLADAITLKGIANLATGTKYNVTDGGAAIATQAAISGETILSGAATVSINKNFTIADAKAVTGIKTLAKGTVYSIADTADNVLAQSAVAGDKILAGANTVTVVDTSANIIAKLDQLEVLAKAGKIADIKFTDTPSGALNITNDQLVKDAEAIGKIISQRTLATLSVTKPTTPAALNPIIPAMKTLSPWSSETTIGTIVDGSIQFRPYMRSDSLGNMIAEIITPSANYNINGQNQVSLYLLAQDGLGNITAPYKLVDFTTSLGVPGTLKNGGIFLLKPNLYNDSATPNQVDNQLAVWMEQQYDGTYTMKYQPYYFSPPAVAGNAILPALDITGTIQSLVTGISPNIVNFSWVWNTSSKKFMMEYETLTPNSDNKKDIYINTFSVNGSGNNISLTTVGSIQTDANKGAKLLISGIQTDAFTDVYNDPTNNNIAFIQETSKSDKIGIMISSLDPASGLINNSGRFLEIGNLNSNIKINTVTFGGISNDPNVSTPSVAIAAVAVTIPSNNTSEKPTYKMQFYKGDAALSGDSGKANIVATDSILLDSPVKALWNQASIGNNTTLFAFQDGNIVHAVQVGSDGKIITDDQFVIPKGAIFDRYRPLGNSNPSNVFTPTFEFIWREPIAGNTNGETIIKSRIYDTRGSAPLIIQGYSGNSFNLLAGASGNDMLTGHGNDVMAGGPGNDIFNGVLSGKDVVSYLGRSSDYLITPDTQDPLTVTVKDLRSGSPDGTDTLKNISSIRFADKTVALYKSTIAKNLAQSFVTQGAGLTYAMGTTAKGYIALSGTEAGTLSVNIISNNGKDLPLNANSLVDAIVNASTATAFLTAVQNARSIGASNSPPFAVSFNKSLLTSIDLNVDGVNDTGIMVPVDLDPQAITNSTVRFVPRPLTSIPPTMVLSLNQNFIKSIGGTATAWGTSGVNGAGINTTSFNYIGTEPGTFKLNLGSSDGVSPLPPAALKLASDIITATTPIQFDQAVQAFWSSSNGQYWIGFNKMLTNPVDMNGDGKLDTNVNVQLNYLSNSVTTDSITLSAIPGNDAGILTQSFLKIAPGIAGIWGGGTYQVTGTEQGQFFVGVNSTTNGPLPNDYKSKLSAILNASTPDQFASAITAATNDNINVNFFFNLGNNLIFGVNYNQPNAGSSIVNFTP